MVDPTICTQVTIWNTAKALLDAGGLPRPAAPGLSIEVTKVKGQKPAICAWCGEARGPGRTLITVAPVIMPGMRGVAVLHHTETTPSCGQQDPEFAALLAATHSENVDAALRKTELLRVLGAISARGPRRLLAVPTRRGRLKNFKEA